MVPVQGKRAGVAGIISPPGQGSPCNCTIILDPKDLYGFEDDPDDKDDQDD